MIWLIAEALRQLTAAVMQTVAVATLLTKNWYFCRQLRALAHPLSLGWPIRTSKLCADGEPELQVTIREDCFTSSPTSAGGPLINGREGP